MNKCFNCEKISKIIFYDLVVQKCQKCQNIIVFSFDFDNLIINIMRQHNVGNYRSYKNKLQMKKIDKKIIEEFHKNFENFQVIEQDDKQHICSLCQKPLMRVTLNNNFQLMMCKYCERIYINKKEFENYIQKCLNELKKYQFLKKIIEIKQRFLHLKFLRGKNNVKK